MRIFKDRRDKSLATSSLNGAESEASGPAASNGRGWLLYMVGWVGSGHTFYGMGDRQVCEIVLEMVAGCCYCCPYDLETMQDDVFRLLQEEKSCFLHNFDLANRIVFKFLGFFKKNLEKKYLILLFDYCVQISRDPKYQSEEKSAPSSLRRKNENGYFRFAVGGEKGGNSWNARFSSSSSFASLRSKVKHRGGEKVFVLHRNSWR